MHTTHLNIRVKLFLTLGIICALSVAGALNVAHYLAVFAKTTERLVTLKNLDGETLRLRQIDSSFTSVMQAYTALRSDYLLQFYDDRMEQYTNTLAQIDSLALDDTEKTSVASIVGARNNLFEIERRATTLGQSGAFIEAANIIEGTRYTERKEAFKSAIDDQAVLVRDGVARYESEKSNVLRLVYWFTISFLCFVGIIAVVGYLIARRVAKTAEEIEQAATAIGKGDVRKRVVVRGRDELARAAVAFNKMAVALEEGRSGTILTRITNEIGE